MRSSTGAYYINLDHLRALAALIVFQWHFVHAQAVPFDHAPSIIAFPLAILDQGHCGVSLFMTLSGYLFAKLLDGKHIDYWRFLWNRLIRLAPLLIVVIVIYGLIHHSHEPATYLKQILRGFVHPILLPNGGWSIMVEAHFYVILPLILWALGIRPSYAILILVAAITFRTGLYVTKGTVHHYAYWTLVGRLDQFVLGIAAYHAAAWFTCRHRLMAGLFVVFSAIYWIFTANGGFYKMPSYPSTNPVWIVLPTIEGAFFGALIAYYDTSFRFKDSGLSSLIAKIGTYSYSIYLLHFFFVFWAAKQIYQIVPSSNFYLALALGFPCFLITASIAKLSYHAVEEPFLRFRMRYALLPKEAQVRDYLGSSSSPVPRDPL